MYDLSHFTGRKADDFSTLFMPTTGCRNFKGKKSLIKRHFRWLFTGRKADDFSGPTYFDITFLKHDYFTK
jgi:hypothetical protein